MTQSLYNLMLEARESSQVFLQSVIITTLVAMKLALSV